MDFLVFITSQGVLFWVFMFLAIVVAYLLSVLRVILVDVKDTKLAYGQHCSNLNLLYKPYRQCLKEAFTQEWKTMVLFVVLYISYFYYQFG